MKKIISVFLLLFLVFIVGCITPERRHEPLSTQVADRATAQALSDSLKKKIRFITHVIEDKNLSEEDRKLASDLLASYQRLESLSSIHFEDANYISIISDLYTRLSTVDERYFAQTMGSISDNSEAISLFAEKKEDIMDAYTAGDFSGVIERCLELKTVFGPDSLTPDVGLLFALSLARKEMLDEAIDVGETIARNLETSPDRLQLNLKIAEWYLRTGQKEKAIHVYEKLTDTLDENEIIVQALKNKIASSESVGPETGQRIPIQIQPQRLEVDINNLLEAMVKLLEENRFNEARDLLIPLRRRTLTAAEMELVDQASKKLEQAEEDYLEEKISIISMKRDMEQARKLLEEERFEEVISRLEAIESEHEDSREINELKQFAIEKLINRERNRAATIFLAAKRSEDAEKKQAYLYDALEILKSLILKYPSTSLNNKLISNIETVEAEIDRLKIKNDFP